jgi:hypothetical protein
MTNLEIRLYGQTQEGSFRSEDLPFLQGTHQGFSIPLLVHAINHPRVVRGYFGMAREVVAHRVGLMTPEQILSLYGASIQVDPNRINFVMVENEGMERIPLTRWIILHRLKHAYAFISPVRGFDHAVPFRASLLEQEFLTENNLAQNGDGLSKLLVCRSGRYNIVSGVDEFFPEVFASWLLKGTLGNFDDSWSARFESAYRDLLDWSIGKIVVL